MDFLPNVKTFAGIILLAFGALAQTFHWDWWSALAGDVEQLLSQIFVVVGTAIGIYGKIMSIRREKTLKAQVLTPSLKKEVAKELLAELKKEKAS